MEAIDLIREHFVALGRKQIEVPEWKLTIFSSPVTLGEKNRLYRKSKENDMELMVDILIMKAEDESGKKMFEAEHKLTLLNKADSNIISRVANVILSDDSPKSEALKN